MSKPNSKQLHIHGNDRSLGSIEIDQLKEHFGVSQVQWIKGSSERELKMSLHAATSRPGGVVIFQKGMHFVGVLNMANLEWFTYERADRHIVLCRKSPGTTELQEVARLATVPASN